MEDMHNTDGLDRTPYEAFEVATMLCEAYPEGHLRDMKLISDALDFHPHMPEVTQTESKIDFKEWMRSGVPASIADVQDGSQIELCVIKFGTSRLAMQGEQFANELTRHLCIPAPSCRLIRRQGSTADEWRSLEERASSLNGRANCLLSNMQDYPCLLLMEFVNGKALTEASDVLLSDCLPQNIEELGAVLMLDMLLGNPDRLPSKSLGWRGNLNNLLFCTCRLFKDCIVAIDSCIPRRPPAMNTTKEDTLVQKVCELVLNSNDVAHSVMSDALDLDRGEHDSGVTGKSLEGMFQSGVRSCLDKVLRIKGLFEMMLSKTNEWTLEVLKDIENSSGGPQMGRSITMKVRKIGKCSHQDEMLRARILHWKEIMRIRVEELRNAVFEWQKQRGVDSCLTTGFLDGTHPIVDVYELKLRLEHVLRRLRILEAASQTASPTRILDYLYLGNAVTSQSCYTLKHLGVTHIMNATMDVQLPEEDWGFTCSRVAIRDTDDQDIGRHFAEIHSFINSAKEEGKVLVHCHEGKSRSVTFILAHLMLGKRMPLKDALAFIRKHNPDAHPNDGFMEHLLLLDEKMHGVRSMSAKRRKPLAKVCSVCGERVGLSGESLSIHKKMKHGNT